MTLWAEDHGRSYSITSGFLTRSSMVATIVDYIPGVFSLQFGCKETYSHTGPLQIRLKTTAICLSYI